MAYFLFVDESGQDHRESFYEVLAGAAIHDTKLWTLICQIREAEQRCFGLRYGRPDHEIKAKNILTRKTFRLAGQAPPIPPAERAELARDLLTTPGMPTRAKLTALGQARIAFALEVLGLAARNDVRTFASIVKPDAPQPPAKDFLRKDYSYLFERFYAFIELQQRHERGIVVFDEIEKSQSQILLGQMSAYFQHTNKGRTRSNRIVPEPFFVHSDLTTGIMLADLVAYIVVNNVRLRGMHSAVRTELDEMGNQVKAMGPTLRQRSGQPLLSFAYIEDLRTREQRGLSWPP